MFTSHSLRRCHHYLLLQSLIIALLLNPARGILNFKPFNPDVVTISENEQQLTRLQTTKVDCVSDSTDVSGNPDGTCVCFVVPQSMAFKVLQIPSNSDPFVYYYGTQTLVAGTTYVVDVQCKENNKGPASSQKLYVQIQANQPFDIKNVNYPTVTTDSTTVNAKSTPGDKVVYNMKYQDAENDDISSTMTQTPNHGLFTIGLGDGIIRTTADLKFATSSTYKLKITATDGYNTINDYVITVNLNNLNMAPSITNLPGTVTVDESATKGTVIIDLNVVDPDQYVNPMNPVCSITSSPSDSSKFDVSGTQIKVAYDNALDYETKTTYIFKCSLYDGYLSSDGTDVLTVVVNDINEPPKWSSSECFCNITEGLVGGPSCALDITVKDPEGNSFTVTLDNSYFSYDLSTNSLLYAKDYDIDVIKQSYVTSVMTATDSKGATSTATVKIYVRDLNDNKCQLDSNLLVYQLTESDVIGQLGAYTLQDADYTSPNNDIHLEVTSVSPSTTSNHINVTRSGQILYTDLFTYGQSGTTFKTYVKCVDSGSPQLSSTSTVQVLYTAATTTTTTTTTSTTVKTTTTTEKDIWDYTEFKAFFGLLMGLIGLLVIIGLIVLMYYCLKTICVRPNNSVPTKQVEQYRPPPQRSLPPSNVSSLPHSEPPLNTRWENIAWNRGEVPGSLPPDHLYHYH